VELEDERGFERTFILRGGEVAVRATPEEVRVLEHNPNPGYESSERRFNDTSLVFSFESEDQSSRIWVMWRDGPYAEVTETV
jgi:hypothetical protein